jgi:N-ethylmaleimide reductase
MSSSAPALFSPIQLGRLELRNRVVMAPMTRSRAGADDEPTDMVALYYRQRASAGLIISEGIYPSFDGKGYCRTPGLVTALQVKAWRKVTDAVHNEGGRIVAQIMHCGRVAHPDNKPRDAETIAPSAIRARGDMYTDTKGMQPMTMPRALRREEIPEVVAEFARATELAYDAGFDGVEAHGTSGYLLAQFLSTGTNVREDEYGGSVENRVRFPVEVIRAMAAIDGASRVGFRICPGNPFNDLSDANPEETFRRLLDELRPLGLAYGHVIRLHGAPLDNIELAREAFGGPLIVNDSYKRDEAMAVVDEGKAAAVSFARAFIGNPDLVRRLERNEALARFDPGALYTPGPKGFIDYLPLGG